MTISSQVTSIQPLGNGTTTQFSFGNKIFLASDLVVTLIDTLGNLYPFVNQANATLSLSYTVQNVDVDTGCQITFSAAPPNGWTVDIRTQVGELQSTSIKNQGSFLPELHEEALDKLTREVQDLKRLAYTFSVHGQDIESIVWPTLPLPSQRQNTTLGFGPSGQLALGIPISTAISLTQLAGYGVDSGVVNAYVVTVATPPAFVLTVGALVRVQVLNTNTGAATANVGGTGVQPIVNDRGAALTGGEMLSTTTTWLQWTGSAWQIVGSDVTPDKARTAAEIAASVIPTNYSYLPGNVLRYGADPTGVADSTAAIQNASACAQDVYYPVGTYSVSDQIVLTIGRQRHHGEGVNSIVFALATFNLTRAGLYVWTPSAYPSGQYVDGPQFENLHLTCDQSVVATSGTRSNLVQYPAALFMRNAPRTKVTNCLIEQFLIGIDDQGFSAGLTIDVTVLACYKLGVVIDGNGDTIHMDYLHCTPYETWTTNQKAIYFDGGKTDIVTGRNDGMDLTNCIFLGPCVGLLSFTGTGVNYPGTFAGSGWLTGKTGNALLTNTGFDTQAILQQTATGSTIALTGCYFSNGSVGATTVVQVTAGTVQITGGFSQTTPVPSVPMFSLNNGSAQVAQLNFDAGYTFNAPAGTGTLVSLGGATTSLVSICNCNFFVTNGVNGPIVTSTGAGVQLAFTGNQVSATNKSGNVLLSVDTDNQHVIQGNALNGWNMLFGNFTPIASASQTVANPGVFTTTAQTWKAGQQVYITGAAPGGFSLNTIYYVIAGGLSGTTVELAATPGGAGIQCTASAACNLVPVNATAFTQASISGNTARGTLNFNNAAMQALQGTSGSAATVPNATTVYLGCGGTQAAATGEVAFQIPKKGYITGAQAKCSVAPGAGTAAFTVYVNGVATSISVTITGGSGNATLVGPAVAVNPNDAVELQLTTAGGTGAGYVLFSILYEPA